MPRILAYRQRKTQERAELKNSIKGYKRWIDPFPNVHGTLPEKIVYAELSRRGIPFLFLNDINFNIPEIQFNKDYQADFVIPSLRLIIEVQGAFWHSKPATVEADAFKFAIYETTGWKVLAWWDYEIIGNVNALFNATPELYAVSHGNTTGLSQELPVQKRTKVDTSKGIRTLNRRRAQRVAYKKKPVKMKTNTKVFASYKP